VAELLGLTGPIFGLIALGWVAVRSRMFDAAHLPALARFVIGFCLPALMWRVLSRHHPAEVADPRFLAAYATGSLLALGAGLAWARWQGQPRERSAMTGMGFSCANTAFIGYPLALQLVGPQAAVAFALVLLVENFLMIPLCIALADSARARADGAAQPFGQVFMRALWGLRKNPIVLGVCAGLATGALGTGLPATLGKVIDLLGAASAATSLFYIGGALVGLRVGDQWAQVSMVAIGKLLIHPLAVLAALWLWGPVVLGQAFGLQQVNAACVLGATLVSFVSLTAWVAVVQAGGFKPL
jgi:predicted permease